jgi:hypothetical protein
VTEPPTCPPGLCACDAELPHGLPGALALVEHARARLLAQHGTLTACLRARRGVRSELLPDVLDDALDDLYSVAFWLRCQLDSVATTELEAAA